MGRRCCLDSCWEADAQAFGGFGDFELCRRPLAFIDPPTLRQHILLLTSHCSLKLSKSPNAAATVSSAKLLLYCLSSLSHVSVYSFSLIESRKYAFSSASRVMMML